MEVLNICLVVLAVALAQIDPSDGARDYPEALDEALSTIKISSDTTMEVAADAVVKTEDIVNSLNLALAEARFALIHFANLAAFNNLTALKDIVPDHPSDVCITKDILSGMQDIVKRTGSDMVKCFTDKVREAKDIHKDTLALDDQAAAIMPRAVARMEKCSENTDIVCLEIVLNEILEGSDRIEQELILNVIRTEELIGALNSYLEQCLGHMVVIFIADVGRYGSKMVSCFVKGF